MLQGSEQLLESGLIKKPNRARMGRFMVSLNTNSTTFDMPEIPEHVESLTGIVEADMFLWHQLGICLPHDQPGLNALRADVIASDATRSILERIDRTRNSLTAPELQAILEPRIGDALRTARQNISRTGGAGLLINDPARSQYARELANAIRGSLGKGILDSLGQNVMPIIINENDAPPNPLLPHEIYMKDGVHNPAYDSARPVDPINNRQFLDVYLDTRATFWAESGPFTEAELITALTGMKLEQAGIRVFPRTMLASDVLTTLDANRIATYTDLQIRETSNLPSGVAVIRRAKLHDIQKEFREQRQYIRRLRDGSDNDGGAHIAAAILQRYKDVSGVLGVADKKGSEAKVLAARHDIQLQTMLEKLEAHSGFNPTENLLDLNARLSAIQSTEGNSALWNAGQTLSAGGGRLYAIPAGGTPAEITRNVTQGRDWLRGQKKEVEDAILIYQKLQADIKPIAQELQRRVAAGAAVARIASVIDLFNTTTWVADPARFTTGINISQLCEEVRTALQLKSKDILAQDIAKNQQTIKDIDDGKVTGLSGAEAQYAVIIDYLQKYQRCSPEEARQTANALLARTQLDGEMTRMTDEMTQELLPEQRGKLTQQYDDMAALWEGSFLGSEWKARRMLTDIANACGVSVSGKGASATRYWDKATYPQLMRSYHAMKQLMDPAEKKTARLCKTEGVLAQQRIIIKTLLKKNVSSILRDFGPSHNVTGAQAEEIKKNPTKAEHIALLTEMLQSDPPEKYKAQIDAAVAKVNKNHDRFRRGAASTAKGIVYYPAKYLVGYPMWGIGKGAKAGGQFMVGAGKKVFVDTPSAVAGSAWRNKGTLAFGAAATLIGGPLIGIPAALAFRHFSKN